MSGLPSNVSMFQIINKNIPPKDPFHLVSGPKPNFGVKHWELGPNAIQNSKIFPITMHVPR